MQEWPEICTTSATICSLSYVKVLARSKSSSIPKNQNIFKTGSTKWVETTCFIFLSTLHEDFLDSWHGELWHFQSSIFWPCQFFKTLTLHLVAFNLTWFYTLSLREFLVWMSEESNRLASMKCTVRCRMQRSTRRYIQNSLFLNCLSTKHPLRPDEWSKTQVFSSFNGYSSVRCRSKVMEFFRLVNQR